MTAQQENCHWVWPSEYKRQHEHTRIWRMHVYAMQHGCENSKWIRGYFKTLERAIKAYDSVSAAIGKVE